ncbi:hypothetical protein GCM10007301_53280 [Azorhizobium oxalatiphilum]|uniref:Carboxymuconolactone decarboxylase-like domain-containing protein n=1 Tax=Azorhizobium oxalatiphilum TaxID=980631 RepID=A0A917CEN2_9HYPH|nr:carboxymuconolactone decarboxylase family protein [Azorhizobium oxalatiphilum]GGF86713.1 hypothetical protein GCM10007301_53280 [Azorhizobium oxalatiphilum]
MSKDDVVKAASEVAAASFGRTFGEVPVNFALMAEHAPGAFAGYGLMRDAIMRDRDAGGALDLKTKELIFCVLDTLIGQTEGAKAHAAAAVRRGLSVPELAEALVQVVMAGGVTTWNETGAEVLRHAVEVVEKAEAAAR